MRQEKETELPTLGSRDSRPQDLVEPKKKKKKITPSNINIIYIWIIVGNSDISLIKRI